MSRVCGELISRLADQIGPRDAAKSGRSGSMPPSFGLPPHIQWMSWNDSSAFSAASALVAFESLMNNTRPAQADLFHPMREARKGLERARDLLALDAERSRSATGERGVLGVVGAAERTCGIEVDDRFGFAPRR